MNYPNYYNSFGSPMQNSGIATPNVLQTPTQSNLNWVQGEASARAWLIAPNNTVLLMDSEKSRFYIKSADGSGMPSMRIFEYTEVGNQMPNNTAINAEYASKQDIETLNARIDALERMEVPKIEKKRGKLSNDESTE